MKKQSKSLLGLALALGFTANSSYAMLPQSDIYLGITELGSNDRSLIANAEHKCGEGKCGEGKCGQKTKTTDNSSNKSTIKAKTTDEHKCGIGRMFGKKKDGAEHKCGASKQ